MTLKKGLCPVGFLWAGEGLGALFMRTSLAGVFFVSIANVFLLTVFHRRVFSKTWFLGLTCIWIVGKIMIAVQKRRHT